MADEVIIEDELEGSFSIEIEDDVEETPDQDESIEVEAKPVRRKRNSPCPKSDSGHDPIENPRKRGPYDADYICRWCGKNKWTGMELEELITNRLLHEDANRELCAQCLEKDPEGLPYGAETGHIEWRPAMNKDGVPILDEDGQVKYVLYPELLCDRGHRWYLGEGPRRDIRGRHPILFEPHLYNRKRRELLAKEGVVDPAYTMDRWGKRPAVGLYGRSHPQGRKINSAKQRKENGAGFYK